MSQVRRLILEALWYRKIWQQNITRQYGGCNLIKNLIGVVDRFRDIMEDQVHFLLRLEIKISAWKLEPSGI